jgi:hypothetical protein
MIQAYREETAQGAENNEVKAMSGASGLALWNVESRYSDFVS